MVRSYLIFLACWGLFSWALSPAGAFGLIAAFILAFLPTLAYYRKVEEREQRKLTG